MADMSERTMWKDDLHGLLLGASLVDLETRDNEDEVMRTLLEKIASTIWKHEWDMFSYGPGVSTDPLEVQFLKALSTMEQPCQTLMFGMIGSDMEQYDLEINDNGCEEMRTRREKIASKIWGLEWLAKRTLFTDGTEVSTDLLEAQFLIALSTMKEPCLTLEICMFTRNGAAAMLMDSDYATLVSTVTDPFLKPWVQECLTPMPNTLSRHKIEVGPTHDTLVMMPSSEAFDLVYIDVNKNEDQRHVEVLIARDLLAENVIIMADSTLYSGIPFTLSEPCCLVLSESKKRSNTTKDSDPSTVSFGYFIVSSASQSCPWIQSTWQIRTVQQSYGKMGIFEDIDEEHDDTPEEFNEAIYVKTINGKTISTKYYRNMTAAVILQEVERRTLVPRDMIRLVHKGKMISGEKSMKENNIEAKETIEMSLRLLGGMDVSEQMDTHETEEDREKKRKLDGGKEGKMTKANEDMAHLKRDIMEALKKI